MRLTQDKDLQLKAQRINYFQLEKPVDSIEKLNAEAIDKGPNSNKEATTKEDQWFGGNKAIPIYSDSQNTDILVKNKPS